MYFEGTARNSTGKPSTESKFEKERLKGKILDVKCVYKNLLDVKVIVSIFKIV